MRVLLGSLGFALCLVLLSVPAVAAPTQPSPEALHQSTNARRVFDGIAGGAPKGVWTVGLQGGYPWQTLRGQVGIGKGLAPIVELETALFRRWRPSVGLSIASVNVPRFRLSGEVLFGWLVQLGAAKRLGPQGILRLRFTLPLGRAAPYLVLGTRHALLTDRSTVIRADGTETTRKIRHNWTGWATLGVAIALTDSIGIDIGLDWPWVDAPSVSIPGIHAGFWIGGG